MNLGDIKKVYFIGVGGIGMSALARYFKHLGAEVAGYDRTETPLTQALAAEGVEIHYEIDPKKVPTDMSLVVYTPAIPKDQAELVHCREMGVLVMKRSEVLGVITAAKETIAIAGTHGKTTVSSMTAHLLHQSTVKCTAFVGGIMNNYRSNYIQASNEVVVVEADEYDRSFLRLHPNIAVVTATDADHLDIYGNAESVQDGFQQFCAQVDEEGQLFIKYGLPIVETVNHKNVKTYHVDDSRADCYTDNLSIEDGGYRFDLVLDAHRIANCQLFMGGRHNVENVVAASAIAHTMGASDEAIRNGLASFEGIERRFEYMLRDENLVIIDDYAHHPTEITALISSVRELYPGKRIAALFQPHLYSRTRDFAEGFASSLSLADVVYLLDIYPARELPIEGVSSAIIFNKLQVENKSIFSKSNLLSGLNDDDFDVFLIIGAGDISALKMAIKSHLIKSKLEI